MSLFDQLKSSEEWIRQQHERLISEGYTFIPPDCYILEEPKMQRPNNEYMDAQIGVTHRPTDDELGFVRLVDYMGDEAAVCQAARVSYGQGTKTVSEDRGLLRYLMRHRHTTPFEMCEIKLHLKMPVYVARQWIRHRTANINEVSARYSVVADEFYIPSVADINVQSANNKQGRDGKMSLGVARAIQQEMRDACEGAFKTYNDWLDYDMARESARAVLPVNMMTEMYWKVDLHNLLHFLSLRVDPHAQKEIRELAGLIADLVANWVPNIWDAFDDFVLQSVTLSGNEVAALQADLAFLRRQLREEFYAWQPSRPDGVSNREFQAYLTNTGLGG